MLKSLIDFELSPGEKGRGRGLPRKGLNSKNTYPMVTYDIVHLPMINNVGYMTNNRYDHILLFGLWNIMQITLNIGTTEIRFLYSVQVWTALAKVQMVQVCLYVF
jgi:hypothetical protein